MIQFNLLPDVKLEYVKAKRTKRTVMLAAFTVTGLSIFIVVLLFLIVNVFQKQHISNLNSDIEKTTKELKSVQDLDKVLTVQNQLGALTKLHEEKPASNRLLDYLVQLTPAQAKISDVDVDYTEDTMTIAGTANNLETVNKYVDVLKFTTFTDGKDQKPAFTGVVLTSFGVATAGAKGSTGAVAYTIDFKFNETIFNNTKVVQLTIPNIISTRSITEKPTDLFEASIKTNGNR